MSRVNPAFTFRKCLCGVEDCRRLTEALSRLAPDRAGYETLPEINATPGKPTTAHWRKVALRDGILRHLGLAARYAVGRTVHPTDNAGITSQHFISRIHWHPALTALTVGTGTATNKLTVQSGLARDISFTNVDLVDKKVGKPAGHLALPSWTIAEVRVEISDAEALVQRTLGPIPSTPAVIPPVFFVFRFFVFVLLALFFCIVVVAMALATTIVRWEAASWGARESRLPMAATLRASRAEMGAQLGSSVAFGSGCGQTLPGVPRKAPLCS